MSKDIELTPFVLHSGNPPEWNSPEGIAFIDKNVMCSLQNEANREAVLRYQLHRHAPKCFRTPRVCRFSFPKTPSNETKVLDEEEVQRNFGKFIILKRNENETFINNYHPLLLQLLNCNHDIQPVTGSHAVAYYISKYIGKGEPQILREQIQRVVNEFHSDTTSSYYSKALKMAMTIIKQREVSAPEAAFRLCHLPLHKSTRTTIFIPTFLPNKRIRIVHKESFETGNVKTSLNIIDRYENRPDDLAHLCLFEFAAHYAPKFGKPVGKETDDFSEDEVRDDDLEETATKLIKLKNGKGTVYRRKRHAIVKFPIFNTNEQLDDHLYSLILLYYPFINENFLEPYQSINEAFRNLKDRFRTHNNDSIINPELADSLNAELIRIAGNYIYSPNQDPDSYPFPEEDDIDDLADNNVFYCARDNEVPLHEMVQQRIRSLNKAQLTILNKVRERISNSNENQLLEFVSGAGGVGKSYIINTVSLLINLLCHDGERAVLRCAPTGIAGENIKGITLHKAFSLGIESHGVAQYFRLGAKRLDERRRTFNSVKFIIIDEVSMISYQCLRMIHLRLCEIFESEQPFGGKHILLFGDLLQLRPVHGSWCFQQPSYLSHEVHLWRMFTFTELTEVVRQKTKDDFYFLLQKLRIGTVVPSDLQVLKERTIDKTSINYADLLQISENSLHLYPRVKQVNTYNERKLAIFAETGTRIYRITSRDTYASSSKFGQTVPDNFLYEDVRKTAGIPKILDISVGCKVTLRWNLNVTASLCNGSTGTVRGFVWTALRRDQFKEGDIPECVLVKFDNQVDTAFFCNLSGFEDCVKISPRTFEFDGKRGTKVARYQIPLMLCFACTVHKAQGLSLNSCSVYLGKSLFAKAQAYVALSRLTSINGLVISDLEESKLIVNNRGKAPCNDDSLLEICRLQLANVALIEDTSLITELCNWMIEYVKCSTCKKWTCLCEHSL